MDTCFNVIDWTSPSRVFQISLCTLKANGMCITTDNAQIRYTAGFVNHVIIMRLKSCEVQTWHWWSCQRVEDGLTTGYLGRASVRLRVLGEQKCQRVEHCDFRRGIYWNHPWSIHVRPVLLALYQRGLTWKTVTLFWAVLYPNKIEGLAFVYRIATKKILQLGYL